MGLSNLPPGVSGNEWQITGEHPCGFCGGFGIDFHGHETKATVFRRDGTFKVFDSYDEARDFASDGDEIVVDEWPTGEACCVPCRGTGREPEEHVVPEPVSEEEFERITVNPGDYEWEAR